DRRMGESGVQAGRGGRPPMRGRGLNDETGVTWVLARGKPPTGRRAALGSARGSLTNARPHPGPLPQERGNHAPASGGAGPREWLPTGARRKVGGSDRRVESLPALAPASPSPRGRGPG